MEGKEVCLNANRGWRTLRPSTNLLLYSPYFSTLYNEHKLLHKDARASITGYVSGLSEKILMWDREDKNPMTLNPLMLESQILRFLRSLPRPAGSAVRTAVLCLLLSSLFLQEAFPDSPQIWIRCAPTPIPSVSPVTVFITFCKSLLTHSLLPFHNLYESRDFICVIDPGSLGHSMVPGPQQVLSKYRWNAVEWMP